MKQFRGFKVVAENLDSIVNFGIKAIGVWVGCSNPEKYLQPKPIITKKGGMTHIDASELSNLALEVQELPKGVVIRISWLL